MTAPTMLHITSDSFDEDVWDAVCNARMMYLSGSNKRAWYTVLREYCGYKSSSVWIKRRMETIADEWLVAHPTWTGKYYRESLGIKPRVTETREQVGIDEHCLPVYR